MQSQMPQADDGPALKLFFCGDLVMDRAPGPDWLGPELAQELRQADLACCNFEAPVSGAGKPTAKSGPLLAQSPLAFGWLRQVGFTHLSLANNHIFDHGPEGLAATLEGARQAGLVPFGAGLDWEQAYAPAIFVHNGLRVGLMALAEWEFGALGREGDAGAGFAHINHWQVERRVREARARVDLLVLNLHAGVEKVPLPLPEWRQRYRALVEAGADLVVGHHPHVPQGMEWYLGRPIFHSLGDFYFASRPESEPAFALAVEWRPGAPLRWRAVGHRREGRLLLPWPEAPQALDQLSRLLADGYPERADRQCLELFESRYRLHLSQAATGLRPDMPWHKRLRRRLHMLLRPRDNQRRQGLHQLHNFRIESHRHVITRALELLWEKT